MACISGGPAPTLSLAPLFPDGPEAPQETRTRHLGCLPKRLAVSHSRKLACVLTSDQVGLLLTGQGQGRLQGCARPGG